MLPPDVWYEQPIYYKCNRFSLIGTDADIRWPHYANVLDYELEFGVFLGKGGADIPAAKARECIFGYTIFNDVSARDAQIARNGRPARSGQGQGFRHRQRHGTLPGDG